jgi:hypothetical protein
MRGTCMKLGSTLWRIVKGGAIVSSIFSEIPQNCAKSASCVINGRPRRRRPSGTTVGTRQANISRLFGHPHRTGSLPWYARVRDGVRAHGVRDEAGECARHGPVPAHARECAVLRVARNYLRFFLSQADALTILSLCKYSRLPCPVEIEDGLTTEVFG